MLKNLRLNKVSRKFAIVNKRTQKDRSMKVSKKILSLAASMTQNGGRGNAVIASAPKIKLQPVTADQRQNLRIPVYEYLLP